MPFSWIRHILKNEAFTGLLLLFTAIMAMVVSNSSYYDGYHHFFSLTYYKPLRYWINHGLMSLFFLQVGLEIKAEIIAGELNTVKKALMPGIAALGGMLIPACIFLSVTWNHPEFHNAWSVPVATDIAFSLAVLQLLGRRVPVGLKLFLLALAIFDDFGAVAIIAVFYTHKIAVGMLIAAIFALLVLWAMNFFKILYLSAYLVVGIFLWYFVAESGVDAAIAGAFLSIFIPLDSEPSLLKRLYEKLYPWVSYGILPLFAFANAGIHLAEVDFFMLVSSLSVGIFLALVLGKALGVFGFSYLAGRLNLAKLPAQVTWKNLFGVSLLCGIGFTMSLLLGDLAFVPPNIEFLREIKLGILSGSLVSAALGFFWFMFFVKKEDRQKDIRPKPEVTENIPYA